MGYDRARDNRGDVDVPLRDAAQLAAEWREITGQLAAADAAHDHMRRRFLLEARAQVWLEAALLAENDDAASGVGTSLNSIACDLAAQADLEAAREDTPALTAAGPLR